MTRFLSSRGWAFVAVAVLLTGPACGGSTAPTEAGDKAGDKAQNPPGTTSTVAEPTGGSIHFDDPSGVGLEHPVPWTVEPSSATDPLVLFVDPAGGTPFRRNVTIIPQPDRPYTLAEYTDLTLQEISGIAGSTVGDSRDTTLSGSPAHRIDYRAELGGGEYRFLVVWTIRDGTAWLVTYSSDPGRYDAGLPDVEHLLTTIRLPA